MVGFCETEDVLDVLQEAEFDAALAANSERIVEARINGVSSWFARQTNGYWYDSGGTVQSDLIATSTASASDVILDVPSSPHRQDRAIVSSTPGVRYPVTSVGPYAEIPLPHLHVSSITTLDVRDRGGDVEDWTTEQTEGVGEDYYLQSAGQNSYGRTYLRIHAGTMPALVDYTGALTLAYDYGLDYQTDAWDDVLEGVALLAASELVADDEFQTAIADQGQLVSVETKAQRWERQAHDKLDEYISAMGDNR